MQALAECPPSFQVLLDVVEASIYGDVFENALGLMESRPADICDLLLEKHLLHLRDTSKVYASQVCMHLRLGDLIDPEDAYSIHASLHGVDRSTVFPAELAFAILRLNDVDRVTVFSDSPQLVARLFNHHEGDPYIEICESRNSIDDDLIEVQQIARHRKCFVSTDSQYTKLAVMLSESLVLCSLGEEAIVRYESIDFDVICERIASGRSPARYKSNAFSYIATLHWMQGRFEESLNLLMHASVIDPSNIGIRIVMIERGFEFGRVSEVREVQDSLPDQFHESVRFPGHGVREVLERRLLNARNLGKQRE